MKRIKKRSERKRPSQYALAMFVIVGSCCLSASSQSQVKASPSFSRSPTQRFPRISGLAQKDTQERVNALLATREEQDRVARNECLQAGIPDEPRPTHDETIRLRYLSSHLLSIDVRSTFVGCGTYPIIDMTSPLTIDLTQGKPLDWNTFFTDGFLEYAENQGSPLINLYLRHANLGKECLGIVNNRDTKYDLWLDARQGLMAKPVLPHVNEFCAVLVSIPFEDLQVAIRNPKIRQDLLFPKDRLVSTDARKPLP
jgi:hypothetical protein